MSATFVYLGWIALLIAVFGIFYYALVTYWTPLKNCFLLIFCCKRPQRDANGRSGQNDDSYTDADSGVHPAFSSPPPYEPPPSYESIVTTDTEPIKR